MEIALDRTVIGLPSPAERSLLECEETCGIGTYEAKGCWIIDERDGVMVRGPRGHPKDRVLRQRGCRWLGKRMERSDQLNLQIAAHPSERTLVWNVAALKARRL